MYQNKKVYAIVLCAGKGTRMGMDKMLYKIGSQTVAQKSISAFDANAYVDEIIVTASENIQQIKEIIGAFPKVKQVVLGGKTRADSVKNALQTISCESLIAIHDGARPFVSQQVINQAIEAAFVYKAAVPCVKVKDTIKKVEEEIVIDTPPRDSLYITQTPQVFDTQLYLDLLNKHFESNITDDAQLFEKAGYAVKVTQGSYENYKLTTPDDIKEERKMRIGHGYDVHQLTTGRDLILGGVTIPYEKGLLGHSDADVLLHAIMDSLLGALALGDIGKHFPDSDQRYKGVDSMELLQHVFELIKSQGAKIENIDATVLCQKPKLSPYILQMRQNIAQALHCDLSQISVKATTEEGLGFTGNGQGIACHCVCLLG